VKHNIFIWVSWNWYRSRYISL